MFYNIVFLVSWQKRCEFTAAFGNTTLIAQDLLFSGKFKTFVKFIFKMLNFRNKELKRFPFSLFLFFCYPMEQTFVFCISVCMLCFFFRKNNLILA